MVCVHTTVLRVCDCQLADTPHEPHLRLLETFAYGTYADAQAKAEGLPKLTAAQVRPVAPLLLFLLPGSSVLSFSRDTHAALRACA